MRLVIVHSIAMGMSVAFLWHFSNIVRYGRVLIQEPVLPILISEIVLICGCLGFSVVSFIKVLGRR